MIQRVQALRYRSLCSVDQELDTFGVLVGPNASGKTTFLDVPALLGQIVRDGLEAAVEERTTGNIADLLWRGEGDSFELAVEARIPDELRQAAPIQAFDRVRYELVVGMTPAGAPAIRGETLLLLEPAPRQVRPPSLFPGLRPGPESLRLRPRTRTHRRVLTKSEKGIDNYYSELYERVSGGWNVSLRLGERRSALGSVPQDPTKFPVAIWFRDLLTAGVHPIVLNSLAIRRPSPPSRSGGFRPDGSNLPWVVDELARLDPQRKRMWLDHVAEALPDLEDVETVLREEDKHRYLVLRYRNGIRVPAWTASDGTLRLLALTILPYLTTLRGIHLLEEPENGIHPRAMETVFQSLSSVYDAQLLVATHSPLFLGAVPARNVLCFAKTADGRTDVVRGDLHPLVRDAEAADLSAFFAAGILG